MVANHNGKRPRFKIFYESEEGVEAGVYYYLNKNQHPIEKTLSATMSI
ncbi:TPA: hypothetical protein ACRR2I_003886 [Providencia rettgeri]